MLPKGDNISCLLTPTCYYSLVKATTVRDVAAAMRERRKQLGWTQAELAARIGIGREWVIQFEQGKPTVEWGTVIRMFHALGFAMELNLKAGGSGGAGEDELACILAGVTKRKEEA
jgi:y4mF family transcriptional regulator